MDSRNTRRDRKSATRSPEWRTLNYQDTYICPVCRHGQIAAITLMDAFSCSFCRHIFTANLTDQVVQVEDSSQPMTWRWNGNNWLSAGQVDGDLTILIWLLGTAAVILPPTLVGLSSYTFPPMQGSIWYWFPYIWTGLAFFVHLFLVSWLLAEYYQFPPYISSKIRLQNLLGRR